MLAKANAHLYYNIIGGLIYEVFLIFEHKKGDAVGTASPKSKNP